jgi:hypothetical protein
VVDIPAETTSIAVASFLYGKGEVWSDDFQLQAVGPEVALTDVQAWKMFSYFAANYTAAVDPQVLHDGHTAICVASIPQAKGAQWISYNHDESNLDQFRGNRVRVTLWMKSSRVTGGSGVWVNAESTGGKGTNEGQRGHRPLHGSTDWKQYTGVIDVPADATSLSWGIVMNGTGKIWLDVDSAQCAVEETGTHGL